MPEHAHAAIETAEARTMDAIGRRQLCVRCIAHDVGMAIPDVALTLTSLGRTLVLGNRISTCFGCLKETVVHFLA